MTDLQEHHQVPRPLRLNRPERVDDLIRVDRAPHPWVARMLDHERIFRGRLQPGPVILPARHNPPRRMGVTFGLASRPLIMRGVGHTHQIPANLPWVVRSDTTWRLGLASATDLRLVHGSRLDPYLVTNHIFDGSPTVFENREAKTVRAAIRTATPIWLDENGQPIKDLAIEPHPDWSLVNTRVPPGAIDRDLLNAFSLMVSWAFEHQRVCEDPRKLAVVQYVASNMVSPDLTTRNIAEHLRMSRRTLQSLFETEGGLARYIRRQRLTEVLRMLTAHPHQVPDYEKAAALTGLGSRRTLERAMRAAYGLTPRQARAHVLAGNKLEELPYVGDVLED